MPKGSKKRKAKKRKKEFEAKIRAANPPPPCNSQVKEANATTVLANKPTVNLSIVSTQIENILPHGELEFDSKDVEFSKGFPLVNEVTSNVAETKESNTDADTNVVANLVEEVVQAENLQCQDILVVTDVGMTEDIADPCEEAVIAEEMTQILIFEDIADHFEEAVIEEERTQHLMAPCIGVQMKQIKEMVETVDIADQYEEAVIAEEMTQVLISEEAVKAEEITQIVISKDIVDQFEETVIEEEATQPLMASCTGEQLKQIKEMFETVDIADQYEAVIAEEMTQVLISEEAVKAEEMTQVLISEDIADQFEEAVKEEEATQPLMAPCIGEQLKKIKEMVETGISIADSMKELFLMVMDDLNAVLDA